MRDPKRLGEFYSQLREYHQTFPDLRFGQFMYDFFFWLRKKNIDYFYPEEEEMLEYLKQFCEELTNA